MSSLTPPPFDFDTLEWAENADPSDISDPGSSKRGVGWNKEIPPHQWFNWIGRQAGRAFAWVKESLDSLNDDLEDLAELAEETYTRTYTLMSQAILEPTNKAFCLDIGSVPVWSADVHTDSPSSIEQVASADDRYVVAKAATDGALLRTVNADTGATIAARATGQVASLDTDGFGVVAAYAVPVSDNTVAFWSSMAIDQDPAWSIDTSTASVVRLSGDRVFVGRSGTIGVSPFVRAFTRGTGTQAWTVNSTPRVLSMCALPGGHVFAGFQADTSDGLWNGRIYRRSNGDVLNTLAPEDADGRQTIAAVSDKRNRLAFIVSAGAAETLYLYRVSNEGDASQVWDLNVDGATRLAIDGRFVYVAFGGTTEVQAFDCIDGSRAEVLRAPDEITSIAVDAASIVIGHDRNDGKVLTRLRRWGNPRHAPILCQRRAQDLTQAFAPFNGRITTGE